MSSQAYQGSTKRTFKQAVVHLLETEYSLVANGRIANLLAEDIHAMAETFYPAAERLSPGWMIFTGIKAEGGKAYPGQPTSTHKLATISWPVSVAEDTKERAAVPQGKAGKQARQNLLRKRLARLVEHGWQHPRGPVLLTLADLSLMVGLGTVEISKLLAEARLETGKPLATMGYYFDQGMKPTHKAEIVQLYEEGLDEAEVAYRSQHAQSSVGRYLRDYERVKLSLRRRIPAEQIPSLTNMQPGVVRAYVNLVSKYHPDLLSDLEVAPIGA
ncbi:MAG: DUF1670 domain-containing protein [bacterium]|nr:DUF1670 domain-containing protein [bacterium]